MKTWTTKNTRLRTHARLALLLVLILFSACDASMYEAWFPPIIYNVNFYLQGGTGSVALLSVESRTLLTEPSAPTKDGYMFAGWYKDTALRIKWNFETDTVTKDLTLYAKWIIGFTVTFDSDGGSAVQAVIAEKNKPIAEPETPTKGSNIFTGWYVDNTHLSQWNFEANVVTNDLTLYAKWGA